MQGIALSLAAVALVLALANADAVHPVAVRPAHAEEGAASQERGSDDIRDRPEIIPSQWHMPWHSAAVVILLCSVALAVHLLFRKTAGSGPSPYHAALSACDRLARDDLGPAYSAGAFYSALSDTVRRYLGTAVSVDASVLTTDELLLQLKSRGLPDTLRAETEALLTLCDSVRFGGCDTGMEGRWERLAEARDLIAGIHERMSVSRPTGMTVPTADGP